MARRARTPACDSSRECRRLIIIEFSSRLKEEHGIHRPEMTASFTLPCSSRAIRSASSINSVPKPCRTERQSAPARTVDTRPYDKDRVCGPRGSESALRHTPLRAHKLTWCWNLVGSRPCTGTAVPYTCSSRTMLQPPSGRRTSSGRNVPSSEHFRSRSKPMRMSRSGSSYDRNVSHPPFAV